MSKQTKKPRTNVWKLILSFFCVFMVLDTGILALAMKEPVLLSGVMLPGVFAILLFLSWRRTRPFDRVVKAGSDEEKLQAWIGKGAQLSDTVRTILKKQGN